VLNCSVATFGALLHHESWSLLLKSEPDLERLVNQMARATYAEARPAIERAMHSFHRGLLGNEE
jgi:hypothetical protein